MTVLYLILLLLAAVCFAVAAFNRASVDSGTRSVNLVALGLFLWVLVPLIETLQAV